MNAAAATREKFALRMSRHAQAPQILRPVNVAPLEISVRNIQKCREASDVFLGQVNEALLLAAPGAAGLALKSYEFGGHAGVCSMSACFKGVVYTAPLIQSVTVPELSEQTALVTGASRGLGRAIALRLASEGAAVCVNYVNRADRAESLVDEIRAAGGQAIALRADVGDAGQAANLVAQTSEELGPISILVNNAGVAWRATLDTFEVEGMANMRRTNVDGLIYVTQLVARRMRERGYGRIVNLGSIAGHGTAMPGTTFYAATKAAVAVLTRRFAMELGPHGITVNAVAPGFILTDLVRDGRTEEEYATILASMSQRAMVGRTGHPDDIANAVAFLVMPRSGFVTAQTITVDGGRMDYIGHP
jgi:3-oxoacyl-[acyl-carrier protein] reductase